MKVGEDVKVKVLAVDPEKDRISLSIKQTLPQPWDNIEEKVAEGDVLDGKVKRLTSFGAFVEVYPCVEALLPQNELVQYQNEHGTILDVGDEIDTVILKFNPDDKRISLSTNLNDAK